MFFTRVKGYPIQEIDDIRRIPELFEFGKFWKADPKYMDIMYHPSRLQKWIKTHKNKHQDCEDFGGFWITGIIKNKLAKEVYLGVFNFIIDGEIQGHAITVFVDAENHFWYGDYNYPIRIDDKWDFARKSAEGYGSTPIVATLFKVDGITKNDTPIFGKVYAKVF